MVRLLPTVKKTKDMNPNNFTIKSQEALQQAQVIAQGLSHQQIENEHLFKAIAEVDQNVLPFLLKKLGVNAALLMQIVEKQLQSLAKVSGGELMFSRKAATTLNDANVIAKNMKDDFVSIEHLLLALFKSNSKISTVLKDQGVTLKNLESAIDELRKGEK